MTAEVAMVPPGPVTAGRKDPLFHGLPLRLRKVRRASRLSARRLADQAGINYQTVLNIERSKPGERAPGIDTVEKLARALGVEPCLLAYGIHGEDKFAQKVPGGAGRPGDLPPASAAPAQPAAPLACEGVPARLAAAREALGLSRLALGRRAQLSHTAIGNVEAGRVVPGVDVVEALAVALDVSPCWLAYGVGTGPE